MNTKIIKGHLVAQDDKYLYIQKKHKIYKFDQIKEQYLFNIDIPIWKYILIKLRLCQRLLRTDIRAAIVYKDKLYYSLSGCLYRYDLMHGKQKKELTFRSGMRAPLGLTYIKNINGFDDQICFGEYFSNKEKYSVNIWSNRNGKWEVVYSFPERTVRHIHGIIADRYRDCVYILTGDNDKESAIWKAENNFGSVQKCIWGDQQSRCCVLQPRKDCIIYATDSEYEQNKLYMIDMKKGNESERRIICDLDGSVIHGYIFDEDNLYFSTTVEPNKGGIHTNNVTVYRLDRYLKLNKIISDKKDGYNLKYFQYGFADIIKKNGMLYVNFVSTQKYDGTIVEMDGE